ncbi:unnamed protein product [Blepharisma stoltei]|uniref:LITAF domain-containing protein n=1 Tax=Blepharisma stoltei TaxID=1481888 RepID=A0AAU9ILW2_9CILI|nr:unnamed protein product [Blepharisma stoltei]
MRLNLHLKKPADSFMSSTQASDKNYSSEFTSKLIFETTCNIHISGEPPNQLEKLSQTLPHNSNQNKENSSYMLDLPRLGNSNKNSPKNSDHHDFSNRNSNAVSFYSEVDSGIISYNHSPLSSRSPAFDDKKSETLQEDEDIDQILNNSDFSEISLQSNRVKSFMKTPLKENCSYYSSDKILTTDCNSFLLLDHEIEDVSNKHCDFVYERKIIPKFGLMPCTAYCKNCFKDIHTEISFTGSRIEIFFLKITSNVFACCEGPMWLNQKKVHICPQCHQVLAKLA